MLRRCHVFLDARAHILPKRLFLVRHGESIANLDPAVYSNTPDWRIPLTDHGKQQADAAGKLLKEKIQHEPVSFYVSPYRRALQTLDQIHANFSEDQVMGVSEDERLREQEMGNFQPIECMKETWAERGRQGRFFYRFPGGENGADVCDRVSSFLECFFRERDEESMRRWIQNDNVVIIFHGLMMRLFIARWFKLPLEHFDRLYNPSNCGVIEMRRDDARGKMIITKESLALLGWTDDVPFVAFDGTDITKYYLSHMNLPCSADGESDQSSKEGLNEDPKLETASTGDDATPASSPHKSASVTTPGCTPNALEGIVDSIADANRMNDASQVGAGEGSSPPAHAHHHNHSHLAPTGEDDRRHPGERVDTPAAKAGSAADVSSVPECFKTRARNGILDANE